MAGDTRERQILVVGGAGYIGSVLTPHLLESGHGVRVFDSLLYGNGRSLAGVAEHPGFDFVNGDVRSPEQLASALDGITTSSCLPLWSATPSARATGLATETNLGGARNVLSACQDAAVERFVFASLQQLRAPDRCGTRHRRRRAPSASLYAETKVEMEQEVLGGDFSFSPTVLRVATAFGISPRMRFDLTVSNSRASGRGNSLEVYDADTWRPYLSHRGHVRGVATVLDAPREAVEGEVFNTGSDEGNQTKRSILTAVLDALGGEGEVIWSEGGADARNYRVSFAKIGERLGFAARHTVAGSIAKLVDAVRSGMFADVEADPLYYRNYELSPTLGEGRGGGDAG
jgi:nucleoside-diphosphate-sugar epimerase